MNYKQNEYKNLKTGLGKSFNLNLYYLSQFT